MSYKYHPPIRVSDAVLDFDKGLIQKQFPELSDAHNRRVLLSALRRTIDEDLTERQRVEIIWYMNGNTMQAIAAELSISISSVSRTIARAKRRIKKVMRFYIDYSHVDFREDDD